MAAPLGAVAPGPPGAHPGWGPAAEQQELELRSLEEAVAGLREEVEVQRRLVRLTTATYEQELGRIAAEAGAARAAAEERQRAEVGALRARVAELEAAVEACSAAAAAAAGGESKPPPGGVLAGTPLANLFSGLQRGAGFLPKPAPPSAPSSPAPPGAPPVHQEDAPRVPGVAQGAGGASAATHGDLLAMSNTRHQLLAAADRARHEIERLERSLWVHHGEAPAAPGPSPSPSAAAAATAAGTTGTSSTGSAAGAAADAAAGASPELGAYTFADLDSTYLSAATQDWDPLTLALPLHPEDPLGYAGGLPGPPPSQGYGFLGPDVYQGGVPEAYQRGPLPVAGRAGMPLPLQRPGTAGSVSSGHSGMRLSAQAAVSQSAWRRPGAPPPKAAVPRAVQRQRELMQGQWGARIAELQRKLADKDRVVCHLGALLTRRIALLWQEVARKDQVIAHLAELAKERATQDCLEGGCEDDTENPSGSAPGVPGATGETSSGGGGGSGEGARGEGLRRAAQSVGRLKVLAAESAANAERAMDEAVSQGHALQQMLSALTPQGQNQNQNPGLSSATGAGPSQAPGALPLLTPAASTNLIGAPTTRAPAAHQAHNRNRNPQAPGTTTVASGPSLQPQLAMQDSFAFPGAVHVVEGELPGPSSGHQREGAEGGAGMQGASSGCAPQSRDSGSPGAPRAFQGEGTQLEQRQPGSSLAPVRVGAPSSREITSGGPASGGPSTSGTPQAQTPQSASGVPSGAFPFSRPDSPTSRASLPLGGARFSLWWQPSGAPSAQGGGAPSQDPRTAGTGPVRVMQVATESAAARHARGGGAGGGPSPTHLPERPVSRGVTRKYSASKRFY